jgi:hypothetical protein
MNEAVKVSAIVLRCNFCVREDVMVGSKAQFCCM